MDKLERIVIINSWYKKAAIYGLVFTVLLLLLIRNDYSSKNVVEGVIIPNIGLHLVFWFMTKVPMLQWRIISVNGTNFMTKSALFFYNILAYFAIFIGVMAPISLFFTDVSQILNEIHNILMTVAFVLGGLHLRENVIRIKLGKHIL